MFEDLNAVRRDAAALGKSAEWLLRLADEAGDAVCRRNAGQWPTTLEALRNVARSFGLTVHVEPDAPLAAAIDNLVIVPDRYDDVWTFRRVMHEIVERAAVAGQLCPLPAGDQRVPHQVACLVEARYAIVLFSHRSGEEFALEARNRRKGMNAHVR